jgi:hypothetical protein
MQETKRDSFIRLMHLLVNELPSDSEQYGELFHVFLSAVRRNAEAELTRYDRIVARATEIFGQQNER